MFARIASQCLTGKGHHRAVPQLSRFLASVAGPHHHSPNEPKPGESAVSSVNKEAMIKLRKATGYSFVNCRKALVKFGENNLKEAEQWLKELAKKEGWTKAAKVSSRSTSQGLYGVFSSPSPRGIAVVVELGCETDFVARSKEFKQLVESLVLALFKHASSLQPTKESSVGSNAWKELDISPDDIVLDDGTPAKEALAMTIGKLGENITLSTFKVFLSSSTSATLHGHAHPPDGTDRVEMGRFVSIIAMERSSQKQGEGSLPTEKMAYQLCQHIIGMSPKAIGTPQKEGETKGPMSETAPSKGPDEEEEEDEQNAFAKVEQTILDEDEELLLRQGFMLSPSMTIHDYLISQGATIKQFVRLEHGNPDAAIADGVGIEQKK